MIRKLILLLVALRMVFITFKGDVPFLQTHPLNSVGLTNYPPKLSKRIMSSSTPSECKRSSTVFAIIGGPQR